VLKWGGFFFGTIVFKHNFGAKQLQSGIKPEADIHTYIYIYIPFILLEELM
jgi:hypothetical protein